MSNFWNRLIGVDDNTPKKKVTKAPFAAVFGWLFLIEVIFTIYMYYSGQWENGTTKDLIIVVCLFVILTYLCFRRVFKVKRQAAEEKRKQIERRTQREDYIGSQIKEYDDTLEKYKSSGINDLHRELLGLNKDLLLDENGLLLQPGEHLYYESDSVVSYNEKEQVVGHEGARDGFSFKIADGVYYHTGGNKSKSIRETVRDTRPASLYITNKRIILIASKYGFELPIEKISNIEYQDQAILFYKGGKLYVVGFPYGTALHAKKIRNLIYLFSHGADEEKYQEPSYDIFGEDGKVDEEKLFYVAALYVAGCDTCSLAMLQRRYKIGYNMAARLVDRFEEIGLVSAAEGAKPRKVLMNFEELKNWFESTYQQN